MVNKSNDKNKLGETPYLISGTEYSKIIEEFKFLKLNRPKLIKKPVQILYLEC